MRVYASIVLMRYDYNKRESRPTEMSRKGGYKYGDGIRGRRGRVYGCV